MSRQAYVAWAVGVLLGAGGLGLLAVHRARSSSPVMPAIAPVPGSREAVPLDVEETVYDSKLGVGWEDWGWGPHEVPKAAGPLKVVFGGYGGVVFHHLELGSHYDSLSFRFLAPDEWHDFLSVSLKRGGSVDSL